MKCTDKERQTCNVEKMGCEGCYYNEDNDRDIEILEDYIKNVWNPVPIHNVIPDWATIGKEEIKAIKKLIKAYKELEEYYEEQNEVNAKFIPVSLVEEKIEELKGMLTHELTRNDGFSEYREYALNVLQELLEKRK